MRMPLLTDDEVKAHLSRLPEWAIEDQALVRQFKFKDFIHSMVFVNQIAEAAESVQHHPDIDIRYNKVRILTTTHDSGGITRNDFELAGAIDGLASAVSEGASE